MTSRSASQLTSRTSRVPHPGPLLRILLGTAAMLFVVMHTSCTVLLWESGHGYEKLEGQIEVLETREILPNRVAFELALVSGEERLEERFAERTIHFDLRSSFLVELEGWGGPFRIVETKSPARITKIELDERPSAPGIPAWGEITIGGSLLPRQSHGEIPFRAHDDLSEVEQDSIWRLWIHERRDLTRFAFLDRQGRPVTWKDMEERTAKGPLSVALQVPGQGQSSYFQFPLPTDGWKATVSMRMRTRKEISWSMSLDGAWTESKSTPTHLGRSRNTKPGPTWPLTLSVPYGKNFGAVLWRIPATLVTVPFDIIVGIPLFVVVIIPVWLITGDFPGH